MRIVESQVAQSTHYRHEMTQSTALHLQWSEGPPQGVDQLEISSEGRSLLALEVEKSSEAHFEISDEDRLKIRLIEHFVKALTGKEYKIQLVGLGKQEKEGEEASPAKTKGQSASPSQARRFSLSFDQVYRERERLSYKASGQVKTADGRTISFDVGLLMDRQVEERLSVRMQAGQAVDPLIIQLDHGLPTFQSDHFSFDLTLDGVEESLAKPGKGMGFLALDRNQNGTIDDGRELFGPTTGQGFKELAAFDEDGNGWIDESDSVFEDLLIWTFDGDKPRLMGLADAHVGALYIRPQSTPFSLETTTGDRQQMAQTSVYLKENGEAGRLHHIDYVL